MTSIGGKFALLYSSNCGSRASSAWVDRHNGKKSVAGLESESLMKLRFESPSGATAARLGVRAPPCTENSTYI